MDHLGKSCTEAATAHRHLELEANILCAEWKFVARQAALTEVCLQPWRLGAFTQEKHCIYFYFHCFYVPQCLTGGSNGGVHCTDVTNASRTMLFNIHTMEWDPELCKSASILFSVTKWHSMLLFLIHSTLLLYFLGTLTSRWKSSPKSGAPLKYTAGWWVLLTNTGFKDSVWIRLIWRLWPTCIFQFISGFQIHKSIQAANLSYGHWTLWLCCKIDFKG